jgi:hypothetical protein
MQAAGRWKPGPPPAVIAVALRIIMADEQPANLTNAIADSAAGPQRIVIDGQVSEEHDLDKQVEAVKFVQSSKARRRAPFGLALGHLKPHGAVR